ncbi:MAG: DUF1385 domain-containing protein [Oscillospiraceae bacterium]|nr:DUF1385 domain-containing protein [Oscillospiraceae bacterium]MBR5251852.1 DUF1385 domain-containing protein [Oscillospiraceae bacterium]
MAHKTSIGGQALIEGIMMKGPHQLAIAVRQPDGQINLKVEDVKKNKFSKIPVLRGMVNFLDSLITGYNSLMHSANIAFEGIEEEPTKFEIWLENKFGKKATEYLTMVAGVMGAMLALVLFMVLPTVITGIIDRFVALGALKAAVEGVTKLVIFFVYLWGITFLDDVKRLFQYHGAEHKTIACYEAGLELTVENVRPQSRFHPRCGTSFLFIVIIVSILVFSFVPWSSTLGRVALKLVFLPVVVGIAYEILKFTGRHDNVCTKILASPGLFFQKFTTLEPEDDMIEIAIAATLQVIPESKEDDKW